MMPSVTSRLKKNLTRTKQKILQGMGKTERTSDENFDSYFENFETQHKQASKLTHDLNKYIQCLKETHKSSKIFYDTLKETYEAQWHDSQLFYQQIQSIENKWLDYLSRLNNDIQLPLIAYLNEFPELKKKIDKRSNRLLDYDNARQTLQSIQNKASSKSSQNSTSSEMTKITKLKIDLEDKQHIYDEINQTLCMALPVLYENRIKFYSSLFQTFFHVETIFHSDCGEIKTKLDGICEDLSSKTSKPPEFSDYELRDQLADSQNDEANVCETKPNDLGPVIDQQEEIEIKSVNQDDSMQNNDLNSTLASNYYTTKSTNILEQMASSSNNFAALSNSMYLYRVRATYPYEAKEIDELTFSKDDSIQVVEGTESEKEELDDGWMIGVHEKSNKRGIFPLNFTKKI